MSNSTHSFHEKYNPQKAALHKLLSNLNEVDSMYTPSLTAVKNVLAYSKALEVSSSKQLFVIENILN